MIHPAPTLPLAPDLARGTLVQHVAATATEPAYVVVSFPNSDYKIHLLPVGPAVGEPGERVIGLIRAEAKRVDVVRSGGRYVEPVMGRPRRVQGSIVAVNPQQNSITVHAGVPIVCKLTAPDRLGDKQQASAFQVGQFVSFDVLRGATFERKPA